MNYNPPGWLGLLGPGLTAGLTAGFPCWVPAGLWARKKPPDHGTSKVEPASLRSSWGMSGRPSIQPSCVWLLRGYGRVERTKDLAKEGDRVDRSIDRRCCYCACRGKVRGGGQSGAVVLCLELESRLLLD